MVGTVDYIAPEVFEKKGYTETVDFWSLGTILFEMLLGYPPFCGKSPSATLNNVMHFEKNFRIPHEPPVSADAVDLMYKLITRAEKRLGKNGVAEIKAHPFFRGINWREIRNRPAPIVPRLSGEEDTRNFDKFEMTNQWVPVINPNSSAQRNEGMLFIGYTYKKPPTLDAKKEIDEIFERLKQKKENDGKRNFSEDRLHSHYGDSGSGAKVGSNARLMDGEIKHTYNFLKKPRANEYTDKVSRPKLGDSTAKQFGLGLGGGSEEAGFRSAKVEFKKPIIAHNNISNKLLEKIKLSGREPEAGTKTLAKPVKIGLGLASKLGPAQGVQPTSSNLSGIKRAQALMELTTKSKVLQATVKPPSAQPLAKLIPAKPPSGNPLEALKLKLNKPVEKAVLKAPTMFSKGGLLNSNKKNG